MLLKSDEKKVEEFKTLIDSSKSIVLTTHHNPDGDAVGSVLGLYHALKSKGYPLQAVTPNGFPDFLSWMPGADQVIRYSDQKTLAVSTIRNADTIICLDFNSFKRTEEMGDILMNAKGKKILIDHHPSPENQFDMQFSFTEVSSTCELVFEILTSCFADDIVNVDSANCLFIGIMTDTGSFSYACSRGRTFQVANAPLGSSRPGGFA